MSLLPVGISGDETEKLVISCQIPMYHHCTTATFTGLLLQYKVHEDREQSNPHTGPSFAQVIKWNALEKGSSSIKQLRFVVSQKKQVNFAEILYHFYPKYIQNFTQHSAVMFNFVRI